MFLTVGKRTPPQIKNVSFGHCPNFLSPLNSGSLINCYLMVSSNPSSAKMSGDVCAEVNIPSYSMIINLRSARNSFYPCCGRVNGWLAQGCLRAAAKAWLSTGKAYWTGGGRNHWSSPHPCLCSAPEGALFPFAQQDSKPSSPSHRRCAIDANIKIDD